MIQIIATIVRTLLLDRHCIYRFHEFLQSSSKIGAIHPIFTFYRKNEA